MVPPAVIATIVKLGVAPLRSTTVVLYSDVTNSPDTAWTSCKSVIRPVGVGGGGLSRPRMRFRNWMNRCKGVVLDVGGGGATGDGTMGNGGERVGTGGGTGRLVGRLVGRFVGRVGRTGNKLVGGIVNDVGSNDGALDGVLLRVGRLVGFRVGFRVGRAVKS
jgi:hypothetical protein